jgi:hypothetical protein
VTFCRTFTNFGGIKQSLPEAQNKNGGHGGPLVAIMFGFFSGKNKNKESESLQDTGEYKFTWHDIGPKNPFNKRILDCRSLTQTLLSFTKDKSIAESFSEQRKSVGREFIEMRISDSKSQEVNISYPHNGEKIEGAVFKAKSMEDKWDIYGWNNTLFFVRSWTGELVYKASITVSEKDFVINKVEYQLLEEYKKDPSLAVDDVHFIIMSHAFGRPFPHRVPKINGDKEIALYSFSKFGRNCWYATFDSILDTTVA